jgi:hypothetical protein
VGQRLSVAERRPPSIGRDNEAGAAAQVRKTVPGHGHVAGIFLRPLRMYLKKAIDEKEQAAG